MFLFLFFFREAAYASAWVPRSLRQPGAEHLLLLRSESAGQYNIKTPKINLGLKLCLIYLYILLNELYCLMKIIFFFDFARISCLLPFSLIAKLQFYRIANCNIYRVWELMKTTHSSGSKKWCSYSSWTTVYYD